MTLSFVGGLIVLLGFLLGTYYINYEFSIKPKRDEEKKKSHKH